MKKHILGLLVLCIAPPVAAQVNWKDSVVSKYKVADAYADADDNLVYFKAKQGWGVYSLPEKKVLVEPLYQFIVSTGTVHNDGYYAVLGNKVTLVNPYGNMMGKPQHKRLGLQTDADERHYIDDNYVNNQGAYRHYNQLGLFNEVSVAVQGELVFVNRDGSQHYGDTSLRDDFGQRIYTYTPGMFGSGIFNIKTGKWLIAPAHAKVGWVKNTLLVKTVEIKDHALQEYVSLYEWNGKLKTRYTIEEARGKPKAILNILAAYTPAIVDTLPNDDLVIFTNGTRYGLYDAFGFNVLIEPGEYDFIHVAQSSPYYAFTLKNKKAGMVNLDDPDYLALTYSNIYDRLVLHAFDHAEDNYVAMECDRGKFETIEINGEPRVEDKLALPTGYGIRQAGLQLAGENIITIDVVPKGSESSLPLATMYGEDSIIIHEDGTTEYVYPLRDPGNSYSGVFNPENGKWIVPRKYTLIEPNALGYACMRNHNDSTTYAFYTMQGKQVFDKLALEQLKENTAMLRSFVGLANGSAELVRRCNPFNQPGSDPDHIIVRTGNTFGVYDMLRLQWVMAPRYDFIDYNILTTTYTIVDSGRVGLVDYTGKTIVPAAFRKIELAGAYYIANDSALYAPGGAATFASPYGLADTLPQDMIAAQLWRNCPGTLLNIYKSKNNLITEEWYNECPYDGRENNTDTVFTRIADLGSKKITPFAEAWDLTAIDKGYVSAVPRFTGTDLYIYDAAGKIQERMPMPDSCGTSGNVLWYSVADAWCQDLQGNLVKPGKVDKTYFDHKYKPAGFNYTYYTGQQFTRAPEGFMVQAVSGQGLLLGYRIVTDAKTGKLRKEFTYYDPAAKTYSPCELNFSGGLLKVYPVKDMFVMVDYDYATKRTNCFVLENDLKTIKSTFKDLYHFTACPATRLNPRPYYILKKEKTAMYFDSEFQFLMEVAENEKIQYVPKWRRTMLQGKNRRLLFDFEGRHLK